MTKVDQPETKSNGSPKGDKVRTSSAITAPFSVKS
jgi:hypothetical protein